MASKDEASSPARSDRPSAIDAKGLDTLLGFHLRTAQVAFQSRFDRAVSATSLSQIQFAVLWLIDANPGCSQIDLAAVIAVDRASMMAIIDRLELRNLVVRKRSSGDRRRRELYLTSEGAAALAASRAGVEQLEANLDERFTPAERAMLVALLGRIRE